MPPKKLDAAAVLRWLASSPGLPAASQKLYNDAALHLDDLTAHVGRLEAKIATLEAKLANSEGKTQQAMATVEAETKAKVLRSLGIDPGLLQAAPAAPTPVNLGLEFYQSGCTRYARCTCVARDDGKCTARGGLMLTAQTDDKFNLLRVQVTGVGATADHKLCEWAENYNSKAAIGSGTPEVLTVRKAIMRHLHLAFTQMVGGKTPMSAFWSTKDDPKTEYNKLFGAIAQDASTAMGLLEEAIPLTQGRKRGHGGK